MTSSADTIYNISTHTNILSHFQQKQPLVRDADEDAEMLRRARIRSGDYMMTLATELERIASSLADAKSPEVDELERIIAELLYLERNYKIIER